MKKLFVYVLVVLCNIGMALGQKIDLELAADMNRSSSQTELFKVIVVMNQQYDHNAIARQTSLMDKATKREFVIKEMMRFTSELQADVMNTLAGNEKNGTVTKLKPFWIFNGFACEATREVIESLALRSDVKIVCSDKERCLLPKGEEMMPYDGAKGKAWNITKVNADDVWSLGYDGSGIVVAVIDSGVNYNHNDIKYNMWNGGSSYPYHGYDFVNGDNNPMDDNGHGTHCAGTIAGTGASGTQTGMAPGAKIMALKVMNSAGSGNTTNIMYGIQFAASHGADLMSISLGAAGVGGYYAYRNVFETVLQMGIPVAVAAGNEGDELATYPVPYNIGAPGNCPPPYLHPDQANYLSGGKTAVISVGATDQSDVHTYFTSVGPATWAAGNYIGDYNDYRYVKNSSVYIGLIRPDVAAPGYNIPSLNYANNSGYCNMSGTSMATPCTAGVIALMLDANPALTPAAIDSILENTAVRCEGSTKKNNYTGSGRIDAYAAIEALPDPCDAPTNVSATILSSSVKISWTPVSGVSSYRIYRNGTLIVASATGSYYYDYSATFPGSYTYYMVSNCSNGTYSAQSNSATVAKYTVVCAETIGGTVSANYTMATQGQTITVTTTASPTGGYELTELYYVGSSGKVDINLSTKKFTMPASNVTINAKFSRPEYNVTATKTGNLTVNVSWTTARDAISYDIYRDNVTTGNKVLIASDVNGNTFNDNMHGLSAGQYRWGVSSYIPNYDGLTVYDNINTNNHVPAYLFYYDDWTKSQYVIPAADLADMAFGTINSVKYYSNNTTTHTSESSVDVYLKEVNYTQISSYEPKESATVVYSGYMVFDGNGVCTIVFDNPYYYNGGNLLVGIENTTDAGYKNVSFYGQTVSGASIAGSNSSSSASVPATQQNFIPKTTFVYSGGNISWSNVIQKNPSTYYNIAALANPSDGGIVTGAGQYEENDVATLTATPTGNYEFVNWTENNVEVSTDAEYSFTVGGDRNLVANFAMDENHWNTDIYQFNDYTAIIGVVLIDGEEQRTTRYEIGAFCGNEVRGSQRPQYCGDDIDRYIIFLNAYGEVGETFTFKIYDHLTDEELELASLETIAFSTDVVGGINAPCQLDFTHGQDVSLVTGWNWCSTFVDAEGAEALEMMKNNLGASVLQIKGQREYLSHENGNWYGNLNEINVEYMYMVRMNESRTLTMSGGVADPAEHPIQIKNGWTWIGCPVTQSISLEDALSNFTPNQYDYIKSFDFYAQYIGNSWYGTLNTFIPGQGFMYHNTSGTEKTLVFATSSKSENYNDNITITDNHWQPFLHQYANNMSVTATVSVNSVEQKSETLEIGAFCNGECRGSAKPIYIEQFDKYIVFLTVYGNENDEIEFRLYESMNDDELQESANESIVFTSNLIVGSVTSPFKISFGTDGINETENNVASAYPNPTDRNTVIMLDKPYDNVEVYNSIGLKIAEYQNADKIDGLAEAGIYVIRVIVKGQSTYLKITVK